MPKVSQAQRVYLKAIASQPGPVPAQDAFYRFHMSKLSVGRMLEAGVISKEKIDGRSHYRLTQAGIDALAD